MSIIEKAASRLQQNTRDAAPRLEAVPPPAILERTIEREIKPVHKEEVRQPRKVSPRQDMDLARLRQHGMVVPNVEKSQVAEEFRFIKRPLLKNAARTGEDAGNRSNLIMVTSALPGEGKTFCAINLAMSIAMEVDHRVLLVDADVARPSVLRTLGLESGPGLMDLLLDEQLDVADVLLRTNVERLSILPAGKSDKNATELLASQGMSRLLAEIGSRYSDRIVIFDSPPLLLTSEARVLASQMGQIAVVVEAEKTTQNALRDALRKIEACTNVSLIYNKSRGFADADGYGYYS
ncbi:XrtA-associated tyrosine autokinase [Noviherbaspirillum massiliense]|uniref:XrtA-associated tyrosine autokinase n=1 Tax=Noviherbaspirillum massiliense TaxID=1465823 RepID=UPI0002D56D23|nr:XrtA-associated tyrosine autokinase [Noviherbaspirillum massiliense]